MEGAVEPAAALRQLHEQHGAALLGFATRLTHNPDLARDVVQDVLLRAWRHPEIVDSDERAARAWLFTVTRNLVIDRWRSAAHRHETVTDIATLAERTPVRGDATSAVLDRWLIADALRALSVQHREVVVAAYYEGRPLGEIARALGVPEGTVKSRLHYGLRSLRLLLQEKGGDGTVSAADRYTEWDAAYVLGSLAPDERAEYEAHLAGCDRCREAVGELAGMPGLLAQVPPAEAWALVADPSGPAEATAPLEPLPQPVQLGERARPRWWQLVAAAVLVVMLGGVGGYAVRALVEGPPDQRLAFSTVVPSPLTAVVDLAPVSGGTDVRVECQYAEETDGEPYSVWVVDHHGRGSEVKPWTVRPNRVMHPSGVSPLPLDSIAAVEIREGDAGQVLLRAQR